MDLTGIKQTFDYGSIKTEHKEAVEEVVDLARNMGNHVFAEFLLHRFQIEEQKRFELKDSKFFQLCRENSIGVNIQGHTQEGIGPDSVQYPVISITEDVRKLDAFVEKIKNS
jgi:hypothetical protein